MKSFIVSVWNDKTRTFIECEFICKIAKGKHKNLKKWANGRDYWFKGLVGCNFERGGHYPGGWINAHLNRLNNPQGVVIDDVVYLLKEVKPI